jgi:hypothetical protein
MEDPPVKVIETYFIKPSARIIAHPAAAVKAKPYFLTQSACSGILRA